jgi:hypothetical protein
MLSPRASFNASWFIDRNMVSLVKKFFPVGWSARRRKPGVHLDHAPTHKSGINKNSFGHNPMKRSPQPLHSHDISPLDFYLFDKVKSVLNRWKIPDEVGLQEALNEILNGISDVELQTRPLKLDRTC